MWVSREDARWLPPGCCGGTRPCWCGSHGHNACTKCGNPICVVNPDMVFGIWLGWWACFFWNIGTRFGCLVVWNLWMIGKIPCWIYPQADLWINVTKKIQKTKVLPSWNLPWWFHHHQVYHQLLRHCQLPLRLHSSLAFWRLGWSWKPLGQETWT